jgi:hypothetical protein
MYPEPVNRTPVMWKSGGAQSAKVVRNLGEDWVETSRMPCSAV